MSKSRDLNIFDIWLQRKDFLWGKEYYGSLSRGKLDGSILFGDYRGSGHSIQIYKLDTRDEELLKSFTDKYSRKYRTRYFIVELDEKQDIDHIALVNRCGFKRYLRNYYYELKAEDFSSSSEVKVICREAEYDDVEQIMELDCASQALEYRDYLFATKKYIKTKLSDYYVFVDMHDLSRVLAFVFKAETEGNCFEFVTGQAAGAILPACVEAFAERNIVFEKNSFLRFSVASTHKQVIEELERSYSLSSVSQLLIFEASPREKSREHSAGFVLRPVAST